MAYILSVTISIQSSSGPICIRTSERTADRYERENYEKVSKCRPNLAHLSNHPALSQTLENTRIYRPPHVDYHDRSHFLETVAKKLLTTRVKDGAYPKYLSPV